MKCIICYQKNVDARLNTCFHEFCGKCILNWFKVNSISYNHLVMLNVLFVELVFKKKY